MTTCFKDDIWAIPRYCDQRFIHIFTAECQAFSPVDRIGSAHTLNRRRVWPPLVPGGRHSLAWMVVDGPNSDEWTDTLVICSIRPLAYVSPTVTTRPDAKVLPSVRFLISWIFRYFFTTKYYRVRSVQSFFSSLRNWDSPTPSPASDCAPLGIKPIKLIKWRLLVTKIKYNSFWFQSPSRLLREALWCKNQTKKQQSWDPDPHHFGKLDPDPHQSRKLDSGPHPDQS